MKYKAKTTAEAWTFMGLMHRQGVWCEIGLDHRTLTFANAKAWKHAKKQFAQMQVTRKAAESKSMMQEDLL